jgi:hypothetical protein
MTRMDDANRFGATAWAWFVLALGVALRLLVAAVSIQRPERHLSPDSLSYLALAASLAEGHGFSAAAHEPWTAETFRTPGYPAVIAALTALGPGLPVAWTVVVVQSAGVLLAGGALLWLIRHLGLPPSSGVALAFTLAFDPVAIGLSSTVLSETLFTTLMAFVLCAWILLARDGSRAAAAGTGLLIGGLALVRPVAALFWIGPLLSLVALRRSGPRRALLAGLLIAGYAIVVGPWALRNLGVGAGFRLSSMADSQLVQWQAAIVEARARGMTRSAVAEEYARRYPSNASGTAVVRDVALRYPRAALSAAASSVLFFFLEPGHHVLLRPFGGGGTGLATRGSAPEARAVGPRLSLVAVGACLLWIVWLSVATVRGLRRVSTQPPLRELLLWPSVFSLAYFALLSLFVVLAEGARLRAPILPVVALLAAARPTPAGERGAGRPSTQRG